MEFSEEFSHELIKLSHAHNRHEAALAIVGAVAASVLLTTKGDVCEGAKILQTHLNIILPSDTSCTLEDATILCNLTLESFKDEGISIKL